MVQMGMRDEHMIYFHQFFQPKIAYSRARID